MKRIVFIVVAVAVIWGGWLYARRVRVLRGIEQVQIGMEEAEVRTLVGPPSAIYRCDGLKDSNCDHYYIYSPPLQFIGDWLVSFDKQGRVVSKDFEKSP